MQFISLIRTVDPLPPAGTDTIHLGFLNGDEYYVCYSLFCFSTKVLFNMASLIRRGKENALKCLKYSKNTSFFCYVAKLCTVEAIFADFYEHWLRSD